MKTDPDSGNKPQYVGYSGTTEADTKTNTDRQVSLF